MELCSKKIIGYAYGTEMTADLAVNAVKNAALNVQNTEGIVLHSDLGSQYTSQIFQKYVRQLFLAVSNYLVKRFVYS